MPAWVLLSLFCALFWSIADLFSKRALGSFSPLEIFWGRWTLSLPLLLPIALFAPIPETDGVFWTIVVCSVPLEIGAGLLYLEALRLSPMSLTLPLLSWTPVYTAVFSLVLLGEVPGAAGAAGIFLVVAGTWCLSWEKGKGFFAPVRALASERGSVLMMAVALIYSLTSALGKVGVEHSSPLFFGAAYSLFVAAAFSFVMVIRGRRRLYPPLLMNGWIWGVAAAAALMILFHFQAIELTKAAYMISVKRSSLLFSVLFARVFFHEVRTGRRFVGAAIMLAGMVLIVTGS